MLEDLIIKLAVAGVMFFGVMNLAGLHTWIERKQSAIIQDRIGANRATLAANLEPFVAAVLAVILLSEPLGLLQIMGGVLIALGILVVRRRAPVPLAA